VWGSGETRVTSHESVSQERGHYWRNLLLGLARIIKKKKVALSGPTLSRHTHHTSWGQDLGQLGTGSGPTVGRQGGTQALQCRHNSILSDDSVLRNVPSMGHYAPQGPYACVEFRGAWISKPGASKWVHKYNGL
jgi:hypothetical protein